MLEVVTQSIFAGTLGAQSILLLILEKGDICPGQRGRIHAVMLYLMYTWGLVSAWQPIALLPLALLAFFYQTNRRKKSRTTEGMLYLWAAIGSGYILFFYEMYLDGWPRGLFLFIACLLLGAISAHCLLLRARTRLQAFHRLLPLSGVGSVMLMAMFIAVMSTTQMADDINSVMLISSALLANLFGVGVWCTGLWKQQPPVMSALVLAWCVLFGANVLASSVIYSL